MLLLISFTCPCTVQSERACVIWSLLSFIVWTNFKLVWCHINFCSEVIIILLHSFECCVFWKYWQDVSGPPVKILTESAKQTCTMHIKLIFNFWDFLGGLSKSWFPPRLLQYWEYWRDVTGSSGSLWTLAASEHRHERSVRKKLFFLCFFFLF